MLDDVGAILVMRVWQVCASYTACCKVTMEGDRLVPVSWLRRNSIGCCA
jgi:hypothetical protein